MATLKFVVLRLPLTVIDAVPASAAPPKLVPFPPTADALACTWPALLIEPLTTMVEVPALAEPPVAPAPPCANDVAMNPLGPDPPKVASPLIVTSLEPLCADPPSPEPEVPVPPAPPSALAKEV